MRFSEVWKTAIKAIGKNKRRSFLTMIGLVIGISAVITIFSIGRGFENYASELIGLDQFDGSIEFNFSAKSNDFYDSNLDGFTEEDINRLKSIKGVSDVAYYSDGKNGVKYNDQTIDEVGNDGRWNSFKLLKGNGSEVIYGRSIKESDYLNENKVIVIDEVAAKAIRKEYPATLIGESITLQGQLFEVVGIMEERENSGIMTTQEDYVVAEVPENVYESYFSTEYRDVIMVKLTENAIVKDVTEKIEKDLEDYGSNKELGKYTSQDLAGQVDQIRTLLMGITILVSTIGGISLFISGIGVMNMIYISVSERTKEIGVRRAMGGTKNNIMMQFLLEGITLTLLGGIIGYAFGMLFAQGISMVTPFSVKPDLFTILLALGLSVAIGIIFSWLPAKSASKKDIVNLLR
ncbi:putative ABC transport system permease protein [Enterococcus sp. PF1-24]|uniref:ABC transporter permease n=1 Tax=unclassified Enterococcus TaxID=2608891 RepID=UPI00247485ED|nr:MULTISPECIES: ABC transporter permease [unclassified Enterococcus]MDH6365497.1 putative ABC transport system permease protein [Enterococcus sp. PFB1-1]MDH6402598.1 putative ABC transport system permease protein [Enterococcus sp. PF1-24]